MGGVINKGGGVVFILFVRMQRYRHAARGLAGSAQVLVCTRVDRPVQLGRAIAVPYAVVGHIDVPRAGMLWGAIVLTASAGSGVLTNPIGS